MRKNDILAMILPELGRCPSATAWVQVVRAAQELCKVSGVWREWLDEIPLVSDQTEYELEPSESGIIELVQEVWCATRQIYPKSHSEIAWLLPDWRTAKSTEPMYFNVDGPRNTITVYPTPLDPITSLRVRVRLIPSLTSTSILDEVYTFYGEAIEQGAKGRLMLQRGTDWYDAKLGAAYLEAFNTAVNDARIDEAVSQSPATLVVTPRRFG